METISRGSETRWLPLKENAQRLLLEDQAPTYYWDSHLRPGSGVPLFLYYPWDRHLLPRGNQELQHKLNGFLSAGSCGHINILTLGHISASSIRTEEIARGKVPA